MPSNGTKSIKGTNKDIVKLMLDRPKYPPIFSLSRFEISVFLSRRCDERFLVLQVQVLLQIF